jgi:hypothetical protein
MGGETMAKRVGRHMLGNLGRFHCFSYHLLETACVLVMPVERIVIRLWIFGAILRRKNSLPAEFSVSVRIECLVLSRPLPFYQSPVGSETLLPQALPSRPGGGVMI